MQYKVLLTTSGTGSRLGGLTRALNKALLPIHGRPAICYIIDKYPAEVEFVVTVGYLGQQVRDALLQLYPQRTFTFVTVDHFTGPGSSLGYSMMIAQDELQCPFIFHCCDTIITDHIAPPDHNWIGGFACDDTAQYRTLEVKDGRIIGFNDKGASDSKFVHIGLVGIYEYADFWKHLEKVYQANPLDQTLNDTFVLASLLEDGANYHLVQMKSWFDTGNPIALARTVSELVI